MQKQWIGRTICLLAVFLLVCVGCGRQQDDILYDPDTPDPAPHEGLFVSEHGTMQFDGDGEHVSYDFDEELSDLLGLPAGVQEGTYAFLGGEVPVRYDTAKEMRITIGEEYFELNAEKGNYKAVIKPKGVTEKKTRTVTVDRRFAEQLEDALNEHGIAGWNGFDEQEEGVMDRLGFVMYIEMEGGTKVEARGYLIFYILPL